MHCLKFPQVADMIPSAQPEKNDEKKYTDIKYGDGRIFFLRA